MPFVSEQQRRYLYAMKPQIAEKFAKHTPKAANLPQVKDLSRGMKKKLETNNGNE